MMIQATSMSEPRLQYNTSLLWTASYADVQQPTNDFTCLLCRVKQVWIAEAHAKHA